MFKLLILLFAYSALFNKITCGPVIYRPLNLMLNDLYPECSQFNGTKFCIGTFEKGTANSLDCVKTKNCLMLFQFEILEKDRLDEEQNAEYCLYLDKNFVERVSSESKNDNITPLLGVRFGYVPVSPKLESSCFLGKSVDFLQVAYHDVKPSRSKLRPAFELTEINYDNNGLFYCCFKQPLIMRLATDRITSETESEFEMDLTKPIYPSLYYRIEKYDDTYKTTNAYNLIEYKAKSKFIAPPPPPPTTTTTSTVSTTTTSTTTTTEASAKNPVSNTDSIIQSSADENNLIKKPESNSESSDPKPSTEPDAIGAGKVLIVFVLSILLIAFFLLIALSIYNSMMK